MPAHVVPSKRRGSLLVASVPHLRQHLWVTPSATRWLSHSSLRLTAGCCGASSGLAGVWVLLGIELILIFTFLSFLILLFFFSFEIILTLTSFSLSQWGSKLYKIRSSFYLFLFTIFGSVYFLSCIIILLLISGSNNCTWDFSLNVNQQIPMTLPFTFAFGIKLPIFPFHL